MTDQQMITEMETIQAYMEKNFAPPLWLAVRLEDNFNFIVFSEN